MTPDLLKSISFNPKTVVDGKHIIMFPFDIYGWPEDQQTHVILHESAHFVLGYRSPAEDVDLDYERQEEEAEVLLERWVGGGH